MNEITVKFEAKDERGEPVEVSFVVDVPGPNTEEWRNAFAMQAMMAIQSIAMRMAASK